MRALRISCDHIDPGRPWHAASLASLAQGIAHWSLLPLRVRRLERVQVHADLTILARLACALGNTRVTALADAA
jgi:hypothetical protein